MAEDDGGGWLPGPWVLLLGFVGLVAALACLAVFTSFCVPRTVG